MKSLRFFSLGCLLGFLLCAGLAWRPAQASFNSAFLPVGAVSCTQATPCASSATTLFATGGSTVLYRADVTADCTSATATATVNVTITYTDPSSTVQTSAAGSAAACTTLGASSLINYSVIFAAKNGTNIQYNVSTANSPNYQARVAIFQESLQ